MTTSKQSAAASPEASSDASVSLISNHDPATSSAQATALTSDVAGEEEALVANTESKKKSHKGKVKFEAKLQREEAVTYFRALVDGLSAGYLNFKQGSDNLELTPSSPLHVEVKGSAKGSRQKVSFEIEWELNGEATLEIQH